MPYAAAAPPARARPARPVASSSPWVSLARAHRPRPPARPPHPPNSIKLWGRVQGTTADYLVAVGHTSPMAAPGAGAKFFYTTTAALALVQMPDVTPAFAKLAAGVAGRFAGTPAKLLGPDADAPEEDGVDEAGNPLPKAAKFSEAHRLAVTVAAIERDTGVVPKGAFVVTPTHAVAAEPHFGGLDGTAAGSLGSYAHFRPAEHPARAHALAKPGAVPNGDWLDPVSEDAPRGCWTLRLDGGKGVAELRSLRWPGYFFYAQVGGPRYGGVYVGDGRPNVDLHFSM